jgi:hypothetical protein
VARLRAAGYEAFLVGEVLLRAEEPEELLRELRAAASAGAGVDGNANVRGRE